MASFWRFFYPHHLASLGFTGHCPFAPRPTLHSPTPHRRGQVVRGPSPAGECLTPTAELRKTERGPISTSEPSISLCAEPGDSCGQIHPFLPTRRRSPVDRSLVAKELNPSGSRRACRMAIGRSACPLLALVLVAERGQGGRVKDAYGVPGTRPSQRREILDDAIRGLR